MAAPKQCQATTRAGTRCMRDALPGSEFCTQHLQISQRARDVKETNLRRMKDSTLQIILTEYTRLTEIDKTVTERYGKVFQHYLTIFTAAVGASFLLLENQESLIYPRLSTGLVLGALILFGEMTYLHLLAIDVTRRGIYRRYELIEAKLARTDDEVHDLFSQRINPLTERLAKSISMRGILQRAIHVSGAKTMVVVLISGLWASLGILLIWPTSILVAVIVAVALVGLFASLHAGHASWRYRAIQRRAHDIE